MKYKCTKCGYETVLSSVCMPGPCENCPNCFAYYLAAHSTHTLTAKLFDPVTGQSAEYSDSYPWYDPDDVHGNIYYWTEGNFSCDCNRSDCFGDDFPELDCGHRIELKELLMDGKRIWP